MHASACEWLATRPASLCNAGSGEVVGPQQTTHGIFDVRNLEIAVRLLRPLPLRLPLPPPLCGHDMCERMHSTVLVVWTELSDLTVRCQWRPSPSRSLTQWGLCRTGDHFNINSDSGVRRDGVG